MQSDKTVIGVYRWILPKLLNWFTTTQVFDVFSILTCSSSLPYSSVAWGAYIVINVLSRQLVPIPPDLLLVCQVDRLPSGIWHRNEQDRLRLKRFRSTTGYYDCITMVKTTTSTITTAILIHRPKIGIPLLGASVANITCRYNSWPYIKIKKAVTKMVNSYYMFCFL